MRAAGGWKSGEIMIIIMERYNSVGHSLNHREKLLPFFINEYQLIYISVRGEEMRYLKEEKKLFPLHWILLSELEKRMSYWLGV